MSSALPPLVPVALPRHIQCGFVYKASGDALKRDGVTHWVVTHPGITHASVLGFDSSGIATDARTLRAEELRKRKPLGILPIKSLRLLEWTAA